MNKKQTNLNKIFWMMLAANHLKLFKLAAFLQDFHWSVYQSDYTAVQHTRTDRIISSVFTACCQDEINLNKAVKEIMLANDYDNFEDLYPTFDF